MENEIPDDVAFSILSKLPLKSLRRFTCVRKSWQLLFENPYFMNMFRTNFISKTHSYYQDTSHLLLQSHPTQYPHSLMYLVSGERFQNVVKLDWPPPFQAQPTNVSILGSGIHGTLCLHEDATKIVLWNPATQEFWNVPPCSAEPLPHMGISINLVGFGYDHVRDDYKVIQNARFFVASDDQASDVPRCQDSVWEIYSLRSNSWRKLDIDNELGASELEVDDVGYHIYTNGVCHWLAELDGHRDEALLASFNFSNEIAFTTMLPLDLRARFHYNYLALLNGSIAVISKYYETTSFHISILGELGVEESWTKLFIVGPLPCLAHPVGTGKKGDIFFLKKDGELAWFDLSTMMIQKEIGVRCSLCISKMVIYKENLLQIKRTDYA